MRSVAYQARIVDDVLTEVLCEFPAVMLIGARGVGKTTTAARHVDVIVRLDSEREAGAFRVDPDAALDRVPGRVLLDEWQATPQILGAVKRAVDAGASPGRFILTGSVAGPSLPGAWPGTGRVLTVRQYGMTIAERRGSGKPILNWLLEPRRETPSTERLADYVALALRGGFPSSPDAGAGGGAARFFASYVGAVVERDVRDVGRDRTRFARYLAAYALTSGTVVADQTLLVAAGIDRRTGLAYERLLEELHLVTTLPAWSTNSLVRLSRRPKRHLADVALGVGLLGWTVDRVLADAHVFGRVLETFVVSQTVPELVRDAVPARPFHLRQDDGRREIDLLLELPGGDVIAIEVKATAAPTPRDGRHLAWLRDSIGARFRSGLVLHTGPDTYRLGDRIVATPVSSLWAS